MRFLLLAQSLMAAIFTGIAIYAAATGSPGYAAWFGALAMFNALEHRRP